MHNSSSAELPSRASVAAAGDPSWKEKIEGEITSHRAELAELRAMLEALTGPPHR